MGVRVVALSEREIERLFAAIDTQHWIGRRDAAFYSVLLETGMAVTATIGLRLRDACLVRAGGKVVAPRKAHEQGRLPAGLVWTPALEVYLERNQILFALGPEGFLFPPLDRNQCYFHTTIVPGKALNPQVLRGRIKKYAARAGLDEGRVCFTALRYTGARRLLEAGASQTELQAFLRWNKRLPKKVMDRLREPAPPAPEGLPDPYPRGIMGKAPVYSPADHRVEGQVRELCRLDRLGFTSLRGVENIPAENLPRVYEAIKAALADLAGLELRNRHANLELGVRLVTMAQLLAKVGNRWTRETTGVDQFKELRRAEERRRKQQKREHQAYLDTLETWTHTPLGQAILREVLSEDEGEAGSWHA